MPSFQRYLLRSVIVILMINVAGLWTVTWLQQRKLEKLQVQQTAVQAEIEQAGLGVMSGAESGTSSSSPLPVPSGMFAEINTVKQLNSVVQSLEQRVLSLENQPTPSPTIAPKNTTKPAPKASSTPREMVIFLGTGSSTDTNWVTVPGASVQLNPVDYAGLQSVTFEAALSILGGNASARLINITTGGVFYQSVVENNTSTPTWVTSPSFTLPSGTATYQVQIRSTSGERVDLTGSRLRLVLQ